MPYALQLAELRLEEYEERCEQRSLLDGAALNTRIFGEEILYYEHLAKRHQLPTEAPDTVTL